MTDEERYLFDLNGYLVVKNAVAPAALARLNEWLDGQGERLDPTGKGTIKPGGTLLWGPEFRALLDNPVVLPYLRELLGDGLRLDHEYAIFSKQENAGLALHGGGAPYDPSQYYHFRNGRPFSGLTVISYALRPIGPGEGGFAAIPGSHKANLPCPKPLRVMQDAHPNELVRQIPQQAGDCVIFTEALTHGTFPWRAAHTRRSILFKFAPAHMSWGSGTYFPAPGNDSVMALDGDLTDAQRALLAPPGIWQRRPVP